MQVLLPDRLRELCVLTVHLLQILVFLLGVLLSVPYFILQRGPGSFQLLLQTGYLRTDTTSAYLSDPTYYLKEIKKKMSSSQSIVKAI